MSLKHYGGGQPDTTTQTHTRTHNVSLTHTRTHNVSLTHTYTCRKSLNHLGQDSVATLDFGQKHVNTEHKEGFICGGRSPLHQPVFTGLVQKVEQRAATMKSWIGWRSADSWLCNVFFTCKKVIVLCSFVYRDWRIQFFFKARLGAEQGISISAHFIINISLECPSILGSILLDLDVCKTPQAVQLLENEKRCLTHL